MYTKKHAEMKNCSKYPHGIQGHFSNVACHIVRAFKNKKFLTTTEAARQLCSEGFTLQPPAIRTLLKASGFTCEQEQPLKVKSNPAIHKKHVAFARNYINYTRWKWRLKKTVTKKTKNGFPPVRAGGHIMQGLLETLEEQNLSKSEIEFLHNNTKSHTAANTKK
ncbi:hypothetical protein PHYBLDRAFT_151925 [Phycomyces blakesleeanus NRRL 1555(-)]|uniref:Homeodomain-like DNA binding domain-containing transcription factor n=1 Tax=Phycomyces blakesleeanus (strain ATCC 8743b / DSM 1359 / FGSC 10004 / NBRC 33097 / NRRL 1555) TaxID=763407 RepID=A0A167JZP3_PHYB8|nr:hypothetical protein PHYBLDRAFT_151925 [Phycomyces blakesleeanus NRRL 1555(-)]OAD66987.1 hypothetical protein PHYBLDRAFT_151925 [Phycomyces blakesleeanus NRRL 1555(-)]|eukprot:XP_018285027.1 hypothetical protein PHYBLDRAFT_151925 [Phycomyces blakesleeanus NRRL 1555(-)]